MVVLLVCLFFFRLCTGSEDGVSDCKDPIVDNITANITEFDSHSMRASFTAFKDILERTLLPEKKGEKDACLNAYKDFVCSATSTVNSTMGVVLPCLSICHKAMQCCPTYFPSSDTESSCNGSASYEYGGRPAFTCPSESDIKKSASSYGPKGKCYTFNRTKGNCN